MANVYSSEEEHGSADDDDEGIENYNKLNPRDSYTDLNEIGSKLGNVVGKCRHIVFEKR